MTPGSETLPKELTPKTIHISGKKFLAVCFLISLAILFLGKRSAFGPGVMAAEVLLTILCLFIFGSIRYRLDKNALTYGAVLIIGSTFCTGWWSNSFLRQSIQQQGTSALWDFSHHHFLTLHGLEQLFHADTMLFILGLTFFVNVIAQTRLLESVSFAVLRKTKGNVFITIAILTALVSFASGILDGVSMIGLMIRTLVIILFLAKAKDSDILYAVIISTIVTTVCGMWLAYGEPPNLIMKTNLHPFLDNIFFLKYCLPVAVGSFLAVTWSLKRRFGGAKIVTSEMDILDSHTADVRFLQAARHGEVLIPVEFIDGYRDKLGSLFEAITHRLRQGEPLGSAMVKEGLSENLRKELLGHFVTEEISEALDIHYTHLHNADKEKIDASEQKIRSIFETFHKRRIQSQIVGVLSFVPFIGCLIWHAIDHEISLFYASFAGFFVAFLGIYSLKKMRSLALHEAKAEFMEYLFLFPLFFSITLLQKSGFFNEISSLLQRGIEVLGVSHIAYAQFLGATFLSAILDNNVVADFTSRGLHGLDIGILHLFSMAQIAGYALGGCWTHIGSAQSVVSYAFIRKEVDEHYTPFQWIKAITPTIIGLIVLLTVFIYGWNIVSKLWM